MACRSRRFYDPETQETNERSKTAISTSNSDPMTMAPDCLLKHPLQNVWSLWYLESDHNKTWEEQLNEITSFDTVEDFWSLYNHIKAASDIKAGSDYSLFKQGIKPMWEDEANIRGGRWMISLSKQQRFTDLNTLWLDVILCLIGEAFEHAEEVCGAVVNIRHRGDKISIWTANGNNQVAVKEIGSKLKQCLRLPPSVQIGYYFHKDTMTKTVHNPKPFYTL